MEDAPGVAIDVGIGQSSLTQPPNAHEKKWRRIGGNPTPVAGQKRVLPAGECIEYTLNVHEKEGKWTENASEMISGTE